MTMRSRVFLCSVMKSMICMMPAWPAVLVRIKLWLSDLFLFINSIHTKIIADTQSLLSQIFMKSNLFHI